MYNSGVGDIIQSSFTSVAIQNLCVSFPSSRGNALSRGNRINCCRASNVGEGKDDDTREAVFRCSKASRTTMVYTWRIYWGRQSVVDAHGILRAVYFCQLQ